jgi:hypothetical protein
MAESRVAETSERGGRLSWLCVPAGAVVAGVPGFVASARAFAAKHGYSLDPRQELLGIGAANFVMRQGYPVAGGLSQSAAKDKARVATIPREVCPVGVLQMSGTQKQLRTGRCTKLSNPFH